MTPHEMTHFQASDEESGVRLDRLLSEKFPSQSRTYFQFLIDQQQVSVNGAPVKKRHLVCAGDQIALQWILPPEISLEGEDLPLKILYEDDYFLAIDKAPGMTVHPAPGNWSGTLVNALIYHCGTLENPDKSLRPGIVHRLDKDTSGLLLAAKTRAAQEKLSALFATRQVTKEYLALLSGKVATGRVEAPIGRHPVHRQKMAVVPGGKPASSCFCVLDSHPQLTFAKILLETGRTHQIRVHSQHLKAPVLGDPTYGNPQLNAKFSAVRQMLHAYRLSLVHPFTGLPLSLTCVPPEDFSALALKHFPGYDLPQHAQGVSDPSWEPFCDRLSTGVSPHAVSQGAF